MRYTPPKAPVIPAGLVEWLLSLFPDSIPDDTSTPVRDLRALQGQQKVIRRIEWEQRQQSKNILET